MNTHHLTLPLDAKAIAALQPGDKVLLSGVLHTARDQAHARLCKLLDDALPLPFELSETAIFYAGPSPTPPGRVCGAIGPTTSSRMDAYTPQLLANGLRVIIGKGERNAAVADAIREHKAVYLVAVGGAAAYLATCVTACELLCWDDLGPEAIYRLTVKDLPCYVKHV